jgi:hypothetical protein
MLAVWQARLAAGHPLEALYEEEGEAEEMVWEEGDEEAQDWSYDSSLWLSDHEEEGEQQQQRGKQAEGNRK